MQFGGGNVMIIDESHDKLFITGALAAFAIALFIPLQIIVYPVSFPSGAVPGFSAISRDGIFAGLLALDCLIVIGQVLAIPMYIALLASLWRQVKNAMAIAMARASSG